MSQMALSEKYERNGWPSVQRPDIKPPAGWSLSLITAVNRIYNHSLSPDGQWIAFVWNHERLSDIYLLPAKGGWPARLTTSRRNVPYWSDETPRWSPDSRWLAFCMDNRAYVAAVSGEPLYPLAEFTAQAASPVWMPDSQCLLISLERNDATKLFLTDRTGTFLRAVTSGEGDDLDAQPSPNGRLVAYVHRPRDDLRRSDIRLVNLKTGSEMLVVGEPRQKDWSPRWSPDGKWIAFLSQRSGWDEIWLTRPNGHGLHQLTHLNREVKDIAWSPDGSRLACVINYGGDFQLALVDASSGEVQSLATQLGVYAHPNWSLTGDFITVEYENPLQPPDIYRITLPERQMIQLTFSNLPALAQNALVVPERVSYLSSDGMEIPALLYRPARPNGAAVVEPHGGPADQSTLCWEILTQYFVAKGYTWLAPNYRGSTGYGVTFEHANYDSWGVGDMQDCLHGARFLRTLPGIDADRIAIYGASYGGYLVACCLSRDPDYLFACGVCKFGDANLFSSWALANRSTRLYTEMQIGHPARNSQTYLEASPIYQTKNIEVPILILHGLLDDIVPPESSEEWVEELKRHGKTFEYKTYADEPHGFFKRETNLDAYSRIERFLDWHLIPW